ncbi:MAG: glycosyltransferase family 1 protein [Anaerolineae bacterium]|jgi:glycosyltransferase involved in cell wall biosynthesis
MRIGIDYTAAVRQGGGIGRYTRNLIRALVELDSANHYKLMVAGGWGDGDGLGPWPANVEVRPVALSDRWMHLLWQRLRLPVPVQAVTGSIDLFHSPDFVLPPTAGTPTILTVHDLSFLRVPQFFVPEFRKYLEGAVNRAVSRAGHILADSESTRRDLLELMSVEPERVSVLYPGVEARFRRVEDRAALAQVRSRYDVPERFILGLSTLQPRKNFEGLIEAFRRLLNEHGDEPEMMGLQLVIAGGKGWMYEEMLALVERRGLTDRVRFPGFAADEDLPALYSLAAVFAFPSWYEGFGLPVLEAMACGTPVVAADNSSLPEAVGKAGLMVSAGDTAALASALADLLADGELRARLGAAGREQARKFTWEDAGRELLEVYQRVS